MSIERITTGVVSALTGGAIDVVAVYTEDFIPVFRQARPLKAMVKIDSKAMEQPLETGATFVDHRIILPIEINLFLFIPGFIYVTAIDEIKQLFNDGTQLIVQTRSGIYENQFIVSIPHEEDPDQFGSIKMDMTLREALFINPTFEPVPANPANNSTKNRGNVETSAATQAQNDESSTLYNWTVGAAG